MASGGCGDGSPSNNDYDFKNNSNNGINDGYFYSTSLDNLSSTLSLSQSYSNLPDGMSCNGDSNLNLNVFSINSNNNGSNLINISSRSCTNSPSTYSRTHIIGQSSTDILSTSSSSSPASHNNNITNNHNRSILCSLNNNNNICTNSSNSGVLLGNVKDSLKQLFEACKTGDINRVKQLAKSSNVNARDSGRKSTPLHIACGKQYYNTGIIQFRSWLYAKSLRLM